MNIILGAAALLGGIPLVQDWPPAVEQWRPLIENAARANRLDPDLLAAMVQMESGGDPNAIRYEPYLNLESIGLLQIMTFEWRHLSPSRLRDPDYNLRYGARLFRSILDGAGQGDARLALALWNCGADAVLANRCGKYGGWHYADKVLAFYREFGGCIIIQNVTRFLEM